MQSPRLRVVTAVLFLLSAVILSGCTTPPVRDTMDAGEHTRFDRLSVPEEWQGSAGARTSFTVGKSDLDNGGEVQQNEISAFARGIGPTSWEGAFTFAQFNAGYTNYDWNGTTRFFEGDEAEDPFDNRQTYRLTVAQIQALAPEYGLAGVASLGYSAETDGNLDQGRGSLYGLGAWYFWKDGVFFGDDDLFLAVGGAVSDSQATRGRNLSFIPAIQLIWDIGPQTEMFIIGNQARLAYTFADYWRVMLSAAYEGSNFRTDTTADSGDKAVATDTYVPVMLKVLYQPSVSVDVSAGIGAYLGQMITVDYGYRDEKDRVDNALALEFNFIYYF